MRRFPHVVQAQERIRPAARLPDLVIPNGGSGRDHDQHPTRLTAHFAKKLALRLKAGCGGEGTPSINAIAKRADVNPQTISNLLNGKTWGEAPTIFQIEAVLGYELWTHDHLSAIEDRPHIDGAGFLAEDQRGYLRPPS